MNLTIPALPPILAGTNVDLWRKWFAFYSLPLDTKADIVDIYPDLIIERAPGPTDKAAGARTRVYFNPGVLDVRVPQEMIWKAWGRVTFSESYPLQECPEDMTKLSLFEHLDSLNFAVLAYKYRYLVRPESYYFSMDYNTALLTATNQDELLTFYDLKLHNLTREN